MTLADPNSATRRYALAVLFVAVALGTRLALDPILGSNEPLLVFLLAILAAARFGGRGPGFAATGLSLLAAWFFFIEPRYSLTLPLPSDIAGLVLIAAAGAGIAVLAQSPAASPREAASLERAGAPFPFFWRVALLGSALTSLLLLTGLLYRDFQGEQYAQAWVAHTYRVLNEAEGLMTRLEEGESAARGYLLTGERGDLESLQSAQREAQAALQSLRGITEDNPAQEPRLANLERLESARFDAIQAAVQARDARGLRAASRAVQIGSGAQLMNVLRAAVQEMEAEERNLLARRTAEVRQQAIRTRWLLGLGTGGLLLLLVLAGAVIERDLQDRERARRAILHGEERLRLALDSANAGAWEWDLRTGENIWSEDLWRLYGLMPHSCRPSYDAWRNVIHPEDRARAEAVVAEAARDGVELSVEFRAGHENGSYRWLLARGKPLPDAQGRPIRYLGIVLDITQRKLAEDALREREQNMRRFTDAAPVAIAMFDREMRYLAASARFCEDFRLTGRDLTGHSHYDIFPEMPEHWRKVHGRCLAGAAEHNDGEAFTRADGQEQWIRWAIQPWRGTDGGVGGLVLFSEDITLQMQSQQAVRESEQVFRNLANAIPQLCWMADSDGWVFWLNQRWYDYTGATPEQMQGWGWQSVLDPLMLTHVMESWRAALAAVEPVEMVLPLRAADGAFHPFLTRVVPVRDADGELSRWFGTNTDITGQQNAEEALRRTSEQRRLALEAAELGSWDFRAATGEVEWDEHCRAMYGFGSGEGTAYGEVMARIHPEDLPATEAAVQRAVSGADGGAYHSEHRVLWPDGSVHWVASHGRAYFDSRNGAGPSRFIGVNMDITERKLAEIEIRQLNVQLEKRVQERTAELQATNRELEAFAYSVSHDLRAPLRGIDGWSLALLEDYQDRLDPQAQLYLQRLRSETQRMGTLIDDLLQLSRITRGEMQRTGVDLSGLARDVVARLRDLHADRIIDFSIADGLTVSGDPRLLEIALTNLFSNAVKFTGLRPEARIEFRRDPDRDAGFYVRDNGVGFDMAYAHELFGAFQRLHKISEFPGNGIGLATVQRIIHRHGGSIRAEAQPGVGATFYFTVGSQ